MFAIAVALSTVAASLPTNLSQEQCPSIIGKTCRYCSGDGPSHCCSGQCLKHQAGHQAECTCSSLQGLYNVSQVKGDLPRQREEAFLAKWGHVVSRVSPKEYVEVGRRLQGGDPFSLLMQAIQNIANTWQSLVNAFKSEYSEEIVDKEFSNGWSKFKEATKIFQGAGLQYDKTDEFFADIQDMVQIPDKYRSDFNDQIKWIKFFDNVTWSEHNTQFATGKGGDDTMFTMYARNRQADQKIDVLFLTCVQEFSLADNYFVISEHKSILGGLFDKTTLKFKDVPAGISTEQLMFVSEYFQLLAYQEIALAQGIANPPDPTFPPAAPTPTLK